MGWLLPWLAVLALGIAVMVLVLRLRRLEEQIAPCRREKEELSAELEHYRSLLDHTMRALQDAVLLVNAEGVISSANPAAEHLLGTGLVGQTLLQRTLCYDLNLILTRCVQTQRPQHAELRLNHPYTRTVFVRVLPLPTAPQAAEAAYLVVLTDLSELRRLEQVRSDFVANVSHELRTPLASIRANAEALLDNPPDDPDIQRRFLNTIVQQTERLARMTDDLLVLAQAEARPIPQAQEICLEEVVRSLVEQLRSQAEVAQVAVHMDIPEGFTVCAQRDQLEQILWNLIDNAIKYNRPGGQVCVRAYKIPEGSEIVVEDTGIGIPHEHLERIFERFYRVDKARSRAKGGTGLGLSIVKHLVEAHGGRVWVESEWGVGSRFGFILPDSRAGQGCH
ncbi:MAG: ATP-binding protein [Armatimonadota bacterium]|nr:ATP-binding protein [Armatimonadota bacterium]MDW8104264.1 ATP-binding protein [Armatimonadota bacterium]MDW8290414.1 ATP-binding protein [Armatimonadota bacterium]